MTARAIGFIPWVAVAACLFVPAARAAVTSSAAGSLADMSLEELAQIEVFSASRQLEPTHGLPNAIFVLSGEDLRRSGATSVPDALRLVPGVQVGRVDANKWAVSMRGFNSREANKLLVLVDGRSIYDPLFSGMLWESHDFFIEDIERIEVIRGPGGTLWGANAFNGIINIVTRSAHDTVGTMTSLTAGDEDRYIAGFRHGFRTGDGQAARIYVQARERDEGFSEPVPAYDASKDLRGGFRWDWTDGADDDLRLSGELFDAESGIRESPDIAHTVQHGGYHVLGRWSRSLSEDSGLRLRIYYDHADYESLALNQERSTWDMEFQHNLRVGARHRLVWGLGYRDMRDHLESGFPGLADILPARRNDTIETVFFQDSIELIPESLELVAGVKFENTDYADSRWLPSLRASWTPDEDQTWWAAVSEATRVPSRIEADLTFFGIARIGDDFGAERVRAYEAGHRRLVSSRLWVDLAVFYNDYSHLRTTEADGALRNRMHGHTRGAELAVRWEAAAAWRIDTSYTWLDMDLSLDPDSTAVPASTEMHEGLVGRHQLALRSMLDLREDLGLDATLRCVDELETLGFPGYTELDLVLNWRPRPDWELSLAGSNLLDAHHWEQGFPFTDSGMPSETERAFYVRAVWRRE